MFSFLQKSEIGKSLKKGGKEEMQSSLEDDSIIIQRALEHALEIRSAICVEYIFYQCEINLLTVAISEDTIF